MGTLCLRHLACRDYEYFYFDADGVRQYTSASLVGATGEQMCGSTNAGWSEEIYSFHQQFSHVADELTLKVRATAAAIHARCRGPFAAAIAELRRPPP